MKEYKIYDNWKESYFIKRINRFTIMIRTNKNEILNAYLPNTGRLEEHLIPENRIYLTKIKTEKFNYKAISTFYQNSFVFIDTIKLNKLFEIFVNEGLIDEFKNPILLCNEYSIKKHRFDFSLRDFYHKKVLIEIKSCTLCHNHTAMFPDAPSKRALSHILLLSYLADLGYKPWIIFLISHNFVEKFIPNFHTDPDFAKTLLKLDNLNIAAFKYKLINPGTVDLDSITKVKLDMDTIKTHLTISGSYLLILENPEDKKIQVGSLGKIAFKKGYYVYVGSALNGIDKRVRRHYSKIKNKRWHIDYISPSPMKIIRNFKIRRKDRIEDRLAYDLMKISDSRIPKFGSSDSTLDSHLFFFKTSPLQKQDFIKIVLNYQTFTEKAG